MEDIAIDVAFRKYDTDGSGTISINELAELCEELGEKLDRFEIEQALQQLDLDGNHVIDKEEFKAWWSGRANDVVGAKLRAIAEQGRKENNTDIFTACWYGNIDIAERFLQADPSCANAIDSSEFGEGNTPLHYASYQGHLDLVKLLVEQYRAGVNARNDSGCTSIFLASQQGHLPVVQYLLRQAARINIADSQYGFSPVEVARTEDLRQLLEGNCDFAPPRQPERPPIVECPRFGNLTVSWNYRGGEQSSAKSLAVSAFVVQVIRSHVPMDSDEEESSSDEDNDSEEGGIHTARSNVSKSQYGTIGPDGECILREEIYQGADRSSVQLVGLKYPFPIQARVAAVNACGKSEWSPSSEPLLCTSVPTVLEAPKVLPIGKASIKVTWPKAKSNGSKLMAYKLEATQIGSDGLRSEWDTIGVFPATMFEAVIDNLQSGATYKFRVTCSNRLGKSKPGPASAPFKVVGKAWTRERSMSRTRPKP